MFGAGTSLGKVSLYDCRVTYAGTPARSPLNDADRLRQMLREIARVVGLHIVRECEHQFRPFGITMTYILSESHLSIHTWPERNTCAIDLYSCRSDYDEARVAGIIRAHLPIEGMVVSAHSRQV